MIKVIIFLLSTCVLYSCYPIYSMQSAKALEKGKVSGVVGLSSPILNPILGARVGLGQNYELGVKSSLESNEIGLKYSFKEDQNQNFQHAIQLTAGNTLYNYYTQSNEALKISVFTAPYLLSLHNNSNIVRLYTKIGPSFSIYNQHYNYGLINSIGISFGKKVSINTELYSHIPINSKGYKFSSNSTEFNYFFQTGIAIGIVIGKF